MSIAFVFPGQGSQSVGMLGDYLPEHAVVKETFDNASSVLEYDLWALVQNGPADQLNQTEYTQPALLAAGFALWKLWNTLEGRRPSYLAGHSLGEYTALVCAGALDFKDAIKLVAHRGRYMQEAIPQGKGAMAAIIGLPDETVETLCDQARKTDVLSPANYNSIGQVVVAGHKAAVERVLPLAEQAGARMAKLIPVSAPSHCSLMRPAAEHLQRELSFLSFCTPEISVINNVDVTIEQESEAIKEALVRQLYSPVRWVETIQWMAKQSVDLIVECGPGTVLQSINKRIIKSVLTLGTQTPTKFMQTLEKVKQGTVAR